MHSAGKLLGMDGARLLHEIPDADLALFGSIEFAAGALGLGQVGGVQIGPSRRSRGPRRPSR
jgi:hypothetical protein